MAQVGHSLSLSDLLMVTNFKEAFGKNDKKAINQFLYENGLDTAETIDEVTCRHRNLQGNIVECLRYEGIERRDPQWLRSEGCSWENKVESSPLEVRIKLKQMGRTFSDVFNDYADKHAESDK